MVNKVNIYSRITKFEQLMLKLLDIDVDAISV